MITKCIQVAIEYSSNNILKEVDFYKELRDLQYNSYLACNRAISYMYENDMQNFIIKETDLPRSDDKKLYGKSFAAWIENRMNEYMPGALSSNVAQTRQFVVNRYKNDKKAGLLKGNVSLTTFKRTNPIIIHNKFYNIIETPKGLGVEIGFFNLPKQKELGIKRVNFLFPKLGSSEKSIIRRLLDKSYKQGAMQISYNQKKKKWMATISFSFNLEEIKTNENLVMGIDLGVSKVATLSIYDASKYEYIKMSFKDTCIDGTELMHYRQKLESRRKALSIASKWASDNNRGHGYKTKMEKANYMGRKYNNFRDTYNHKVSRYIVDVAIKYRVGLIQMEDLSGFSEQQQESLLKNWSYYDLQQKIKYKAEENGIRVYFINPKYTSQRCSKCGNIDKENRKTQESFSCTVCNYKDNADVNASKNIAIPDIEKIIEEQVKKQY